MPVCKSSKIRTAILYPFVRHLSDLPVAEAMGQTAGMKCPNWDSQLFLPAPTTKGVWDRFNLCMGLHPGETLSQEVSVA